MSETIVREARDIPRAGDIQLEIGQPPEETDFQYSARMLELVASMLAGDRATVESRLCRLTALAIDGRADQSLPLLGLNIFEQLIDRERMHHEWHQRQNALEAQTKPRKQTISLRAGSSLLSVETMLEVRRDISNAMRYRPEAMCERMRPFGQYSESVMRDWAVVLQQSRVLVWDEAIWLAATRGDTAFDREVMQAAWVPCEPLLWFWPAGLKAVSDRGWYAARGLKEDTGLLCSLISYGTVATVEEIGDWSLENPERRPGGTEAFTVWEFWVDISAARDGWLPFILSGRIAVGQEIIEISEYVAASRFLALPFVEEEQAHQTRQMRRAYERRYGEPPPVRVVTLRKSSRAEEQPLAGPHRQFDCHFLVKDHWRKRAIQWNKGEGPIYVSAHVKGDREKPFRAPRETIYHARR